MASLDPVKLPASSTEEETGKVKLTSRPHRPNTWAQISTVELPLSKIPVAETQSWGSVSVCPVQTEGKCQHRNDELPLKLRERGQCWERRTKNNGQAMQELRGRCRQTSDQPRLVWRLKRPPE